MSKIIILLTVILATQTSAASEVKSYGDLYLVDELNSAGNKFKLGLEYSNETSNTFQAIHEGVLSADYLIKDYLSLGIQGSLAMSSDRSLSDAVREKLAEAGYEQNFYQPKSTILATLGLRPLAGRLNFFQKTTVPFELWAKVGYGISMYDQPQVNYQVALWQVNMNSFIFKNSGLQVGVGQEIENILTSDEEILAKFKVRVGWLIRF